MFLYTESTEGGGNMNNDLADIIIILLNAVIEIIKTRKDK